MYPDDALWITTAGLVHQHANGDRRASARVAAPQGCWAVTAEHAGFEQNTRTVFMQDNVSPPPPADPGYWVDPRAVDPDLADIEESL